MIGTSGSLHQNRHITNTFISYKDRKNPSFPGDLLAQSSL